MDVNKDKYALITGASSGIGYEIAKLLMEKGYNLILPGRSVDKLVQIKNDWEGDIEVVVIKSDLSVPGAPKDLYDKISELNIRPEILINNAGFGMAGAIEGADPGELEQMLTLNVVALSTLTRLFAKDMTSSVNGKILNVASTAGYIPLPYMAAYSASKAYVVAFSRALRAELSQKGVCVSCLSPGATDTNFFKVAKANTSAGLFDKSHFMGAGDVAQIAVDGLFDNKAEIIPGGLNKIFRRLAFTFPTSLVGAIVKKSAL